MIEVAGRNTQTGIIKILLAFKNVKKKYDHSEQIHRCIKYY